MIGCLLLLAMIYLLLSASAAACAIIFPTLFALYRVLVVPALIICVIVTVLSKLD